jgi:predicted transposase/invertase (TIGR01784 family)
MKTDNLFYRIFSTLPGLALELAGVTVANPGGYSFRAEEIKQTAFRLDGLLTPPPDDSDAPLIFLETQAQPDDDFYGRFFAEIFLYLYRAVPRPGWRALVIYPRRTTERLDPCYASLLTLPEVRRVYLEDLVEVPTPSLGIQLLQLVTATPRTVLERAHRLARAVRAAGPSPPFPLAEVLDLIETIVVYRLPKLTRQEIQTMLGFTHTDLKKSRFYQEVFAEGQEEGRQEGRREECIALVLRLLNRRLGRLPASETRRIQHLSLTAAEALAEALLDFQNPSDLATWLAARPDETF